MSEMKTVVDPELAVAHLVFKVANLKSSCQFYSNLSLPPFFIEATEATAHRASHLVPDPGGDAESGRGGVHDSSPRSRTEDEVAATVAVQTAAIYRPERKKRSRLCLGCQMQQSKEGLSPNAVVSYNVARR